MFFLGALYMQQVLGYGALDVGLAFPPGYHLAYLVGAALVVAALAIAVGALRPERPLLTASTPQPEPA